MIPKKPPRSEWRAFDAMSEAKRHRAALSDPDCPPASKAQLARAHGGIRREHVPVHTRDRPCLTGTGHKAMSRPPGPWAVAR
jgi:hypothetical protein